MRDAGQREHVRTAAGGRHVTDLIPKLAHGIKETVVGASLERAERGKSARRPRHNDNDVQRRRGSIRTSVSRRVIFSRRINGQ